MRRRQAGRGEALAAGLLAAALGGCLQAQNHVMTGDENQVRIQYYGDIDATAPMARQYCAQFERVPQRRESDVDSVTYACIVPGRPGPAVHG
jgi:hypothetical protein